MKRKNLVKIGAPFFALAVVATACGSSGQSATTTTKAASSESTSTPASTASSAASTTAATKAVPTADSGAATLRAGLNGLLTEHVYLAALATSAALRGDAKAFDAYAAALNGPTNSNTADLTAAITSAYGADVGKAFDGLWRSEAHIPAFVAYTQAVAAGDQAKADKAIADLTSYAKVVGTTLNKVNENLPAAEVEKMVITHATTLKTVIDAQKAGDQPKVYSSLRMAYSHMDHLAEALAVATAKKFPTKFDGDASSKAATLRAGFTMLLREHVFLASSATGAALAGRQPQFEAAAGALNGPTGSNSADIVAAIRSAYGDQVGTAFDGLWRSEAHIPAFVAYTQGVAAGDKAKADKAFADLAAYAKTFGATLNSVNSNLPAAAVEKDIVQHATTLKAVIDAQKAGDAAAVAMNLRMAVAHMSMTADTLASATVKKFPEKF